MTLHRHSTLRCVALAMAAALIIIPLLATSKGNPRWDDDEQRRRSDAIFMEAMRQNALDNDDAHFELLRAAWHLDTTNTEIGALLGFYYMMLGQNDTLLPYRGYYMLKHHFDLHPTDYYHTLLYGTLNTRMGNNAEAVRVWTKADSLFPHKPDITLQLANALQLTGDSAQLRRSIEVLNRVERAEGVDVGITSHKVRALAALADTDAIIRELHHLIGGGKNLSSSLVYAGDVFAALEMPDSALAAYDRASEADPSNGLAYYSKARFYLNRGRDEDYEREIYMTLLQDGLDIGDKIAIFREYIKQLYEGVPDYDGDGDSIYYEEVVAVEDLPGEPYDTLYDDTSYNVAYEILDDITPRIQRIFDTLLLRYPHEPDLRDLYSSYLISNSELHDAAEQQEYVLDIDPSDPKRWTTTMSLYSSADDNDKAMEVGLRATEFFPTHAPLRYLLGITYFQAKNNDKALAELAVADSLAASDPELRSNIQGSIGDVLHAAGRTDEAFHHYEKAIEYNPDNYLALNNYAYFLAQRNEDLERAENMSARAVEQHPDNDTFLDTYAWIMFKLGKYDRAREYIDMALTLEEEPEAEVLEHAGDIYFMSNDIDSAVDFWKQALEKDPDNTLLQKKIRSRSLHPAK